MDSYKSDDRFDQVMWGQDPHWIDRMKRAHDLVSNMDYSHEHVWSDGEPVTDQSEGDQTS